MSRAITGVSGALWAAACIALGIVPFCLLAAARSGPAPGSILAALGELARSAPSAALWLLMASGLGWPIRLALRAEGRSVQLALGIAAALALDAALATAGGLGTFPAWALLVSGGLAGAIDLLRGRGDVRRPSPLALAALPALATLLVAALAAPGWLWATEFGGYDALSYHLELPKEWLLAGRLETTPHCVYGAFPGFVEAAFLHLMALRGRDAGAAHEAAVSCQLLVAGLALATAWVSGTAAARWAHAMRGEADGLRVEGSVALVMILATPWIVVVGSLAYNDIVVVLALAAGLALLAPSASASSGEGAARDDVGRHGLLAIAIGLLAGAACGAKLTGAIFAALPLTFLLCFRVAPRRIVPAALLTGGTALVLLAPWLIRNALATGNPVFPFATAWFGLGHWSAEQAAIFARGHAADAGVAERLLRLWQQGPVFGWGAAPAAGEPWRPQWMLLPWLAAVSFIVLAIAPGDAGETARRSRRAAAELAAIVLVQALAWLVMTHLQSRFLLPVAAPMALAVGLAAGRLPRTRAVMSALGVGLVLLSAAPSILLLGERSGQPSEAIGATGYFTGEGPRDLQVDNPAHWLNRRLPEGSVVLLVGDATPFWYDGRRARFLWQTTWDRGPLSQAMDDHGTDAAALARALRSRGITHLLIDPAMLDRWRRSGWNDPRLTPEAMAPFITPPHRVLRRFPGGRVLVELGDA